MDAPNTLFGFYRALIVDNKDPDKYGRVLVWIPAIMPEVEIKKENGLWARPANNEVGGRNLTKLVEGSDEHYYMGASHIPKIGSWVFIFFEAGNINNPYYFGSCDLENTPVLPENQVGSNYEDKWTIFKSHKGRTLVVSDDPDDERVEITGKKREITNEPTGDIESVFKIDDNQTVILLDEREGLEKILIRTVKGDYIHVDIDQRRLQAYFEDDIRIECGNEISIKAANNIRIETDTNMFIQTGKNMDTKVGESKFIQTGKNFDINVGETETIQTGSNHSTLVGGTCTRDAQMIYDQSGMSGPAAEADPAEPIEPEGERQMEVNGEDIISPETPTPEQELASYSALVAAASEEVASEIASHKQTDPQTGEDYIDDSTAPIEYKLSCTLGQTSERYESGGNGPGTISSGTGDYGGVSYGTYQFSSRGGDDSPAGQFVQNSSYASEFDGLTPGTDEFSDKWTEVSNNDPQGFEEAQHDYIQSNYYEPAATKLQKLGVDVNNACFGVQELIWSTSVQFGPTGCYNIFKRAGVDSSTSNEDIIDSVYKEKSQVGSYFKSSSSDVQKSVLKRYQTERLQNVDSCNNEPCDEVGQGITNATEDDLNKIKIDESQFTTSDGYEDFIL